MPFIFSLQTLLRLREIREEAELQTLRGLAAQVFATRAEAQALDTLAAEQRRALCRAALAGVSGAELHFGTRRESAQLERRQALARKLADLENSLQAQQAIYLAARREREVLTTLRTEQRSAYQREQDRREQSTLDALFLLRFAPARANLSQSPEGAPEDAGSP
jgi:flagellar export protein FliJ